METYHFTVFAAYSFVLGCLIASFLNVCIWRLPRNESVVYPPSHCPRCNARIRWYQNIPIVSWLALRGRCANCHEPISPRYAIVEFLGGMLFLLAYLQWAQAPGNPYFHFAPPVFGLTPHASLAYVPVAWLVIAGLILGSFIDLEHFYLPDRVTIGGMILGLPLSFLVPELQGEKTALAALTWSAAGCAGGFAGFWLLGWTFTKILKKDALGFGDVKLIGAVGAFFGPMAVLFTMIVSSFVGTLIGVVLIVRGKAHFGGFTAVPYGPFLALGVLGWMFWGQPLVKAYMKLLAP